MNYEDKYNEVLKWIESIYTELSHEHQMEAEEFFPELKESKDERIRKELIKGFQHYDKECKWGEFTTIEIIAWLEKQGENSPILSNSSNIGKNDNVKPKFKVGDWMVDNRTGVVHCIANIKGTVNGCYYVLRNDKGLIHIDNESDYHLWTIQDAKDGDVLAWDNSNCIALFKNIYNKESFHSHGFVGHITGEFVSEASYHDIAGAHPATKEQRNLLFQKMKESGYEWDADKKELKEINI